MRARVATSERAGRRRAAGVRARMGGSDTNVTKARDRMRPLILQDVEADGVSGEGAERHRK